MKKKHLKIIKNTQKIIKNLQKNCLDFSTPSVKSLKNHDVPVKNHEKSFTTSFTTFFPIAASKLVARLRCLRVVTTRETFPCHPETTFKTFLRLSVP